MTGVFRARISAGRRSGSDEGIEVFGRAEGVHSEAGRRRRSGCGDLPGDLEAQIDAFIGYYNHQRYHESLNNLTPADVYTECGQAMLLEREKMKRRTMKRRHLQHDKSAA